MNVRAYDPPLIHNYNILTNNEYQKGCFYIYKGFSANWLTIDAGNTRHWDDSDIAPLTWVMTGGKWEPVTVAIARNNKFKSAIELLTGTIYPRWNNSFLDGKTWESFDVAFKTYETLLVYSEE